METFLCRKDTLRIMAVLVRSKPSLVPSLAALINCCTYHTNERRSVNEVDCRLSAQHLELKGNWRGIFLSPFNFIFQRRRERVRRADVTNRTLLSQLCVKEPTCGGQEGTANFPPTKLLSLTFSALLYSWQESGKTQRNF